MHINSSAKAPAVANGDTDISIQADRAHPYIPIGNYSKAHVRAFRAKSSVFRASVHCTTVLFRDRIADQRARASPSLLSWQSNPPKNYPEGQVVEPSADEPGI